MSFSTVETIYYLTFFDETALNENKSTSQTVSDKLCETTETYKTPVKRLELFLRKHNNNS